jgi:hypothetical protein
MFKRIFSKPSTPTVKSPEAPTGKPACATPVTPVNHSTGSFKERRHVERPLPVPEVIEGDGGESQWALFEELTNDALKKIN